VGTRLQIPGTPAVFLDGRLVRSTSAASLAILIRHELQGQVERTRADKSPATDAHPETGNAGLEAGLREDGRSRRPSRSVFYGAKFVTLNRSGG